MTERRPVRTPEAHILEHPDDDVARETGAGAEWGQDHRRLLRALEEERSGFRAVLRQLPFAVVLAEAPAGRIVFSNEEAARIYGSPLDQPTTVQEYRPVAAFHADGRPYAVDEYPIVRALAGESVAGEDMEIVRKDGTRVPIRVNAAPVRNTSGGIVAAVGTFEDISKIRQADQERRELAERQRDTRIEAEAAHARLTLLAEISQFLLASLDYQAAIVGLARLVLPALGDACFVDLEEPNAGHRVAIAHVNAEKAAWMQKLDQAGGLTRMVGRALATALRTGRPEHGDRVEPDDRADDAGTDTESRDLMAAIHPRAYMVIPMVARGRVLGAMAFLVTETDRRYSVDDLDFAQHVARRAATAVDNLRLYEEARQARASAEEANRMKDEFLATLSHELRTPLNAILGWARMLRSRSLDASTQSKALATIERNALAQAQIVEDLLDVSRVVTGNLRLDIQPVDLGNLIENAITAIRPAAEAKGIRVACEIQGMEPTSGDPGRLQQIMWNLLSNATKFTPPGGRIDVGLERRGSNVVLRVKDNGAGISAQFLPYLFERFRQGDSTTTRVHGGLGLGLAIVRHLVELHGGTVEAASPGVGEGSIFTVSLPYRAATSRGIEGQAGRGHQANPESLASTELDGVAVLVVDDEPDARDLVAAILRQHGATVRTAASARDALESLATFAPRVLVADIGMPGEDGYSLIRRFRRTQSGVPAVALTAYARPEDRRRALDAGFEMHLAKPIEPAELVDAVADLAGRS